VSLDPLDLLASLAPWWPPPRSAPPTRDPLYPDTNTHKHRQLETQAHVDPQDPPDQGDPKVCQDPLDHQVKLDPQVTPAPQDPQVSQDAVDLMEMMVPQDLPVNVDPPEHPVLVETQESQEPPE